MEQFKDEILSVRSSRIIADTLEEEEKQVMTQDFNKMVDQLQIKNPKIQQFQENLKSYNEQKDKIIVKLGAKLEKQVERNHFQLEDKRAFEVQLQQLSNQLVQSHSKIYDLQQKVKKLTKNEKKLKGRIKQLKMIQLSPGQQLKDSLAQFKFEEEDDVKEKQI